jgi:hypothetical protein
MPLRSNTYMIDGAVMQNVLGGTTSSIANNTLGIEGIREWRVVANNFSAEYGLTMGSQMEIVTKSGTTAITVSAEYLRNSALDAAISSTTGLATPSRLPPSDGTIWRRRWRTDQKDGCFLRHLRRAARAVRSDIAGTTIQMSAGPNPRCRDLPAGWFHHHVRSENQAFVPILPFPNLPGNQFTYAFNRPTTENYGQDASIGRFR